MLPAIKCGVLLTERKSGHFF